MIMINDASQIVASAFLLKFIVKKVQKMKKSISYFKTEYPQVWKKVIKQMDVRKKIYFAPRQLRLKDICYFM